MNSIEHATREAPSAYKRDWLVCVQLFVVYGFLAIGMGLVPALLTTFRSAYDVSGSAVANVQNVKDIGLVLAAVVGPWTMRGVGLGGTQRVAVGAALVGCLVYVTVPTFTGVLMGAFLHGWAFSLGSVAIVTRMFLMPRRFQKIAALLATFGVASVVAPIMVSSLVLVPSEYVDVYLLFAGLLVVAAAVALLVRDRPPVSTVERPVGSIGVIRRRAPQLTMFGLVMSAETIVVCWITSLLQYKYSMSLVAATSALAVLWIIHTLSRAVGDVVAARLSSERTLALGALISLAGVALMLAGSPQLAYVGLAVFAFGVAPMIPVYQGTVLRSAAVAEHGATNSVLGITAALSTTAAVWLTGILLDIELRLPFLLAAVAFAGIMVIFALKTRKRVESN